MRLEITEKRMESETTKEDGGLTALVLQCAFAVIGGQKTITISATGKRPSGFPRGELLSVGTNGEHNYAVDPIKALSWVHGRTIKTHNASFRRGPL
jgi:uncharacterized protein YqfB (UPF0267 family)